MKLTDKIFNFFENYRRKLLYGSKTNDQKLHDLVIYQMTLYFYENKINRDIYCIHEIDVIKHYLYNGVTIIITLERPGVFIGRRGADIDRIREYLKDKLKMDIEILLKESTLWKRRYIPPEEFYDEGN